MRRPVEVKLILVCFCLARFDLPPSGHCRHASIRTLEERFFSLGAYWAFWVQPMLPSVWRPVVLLFQSRTWSRRLTQSPELGFGLLSFPSAECFDFMPRRASLSAGCCATARRLLRSPTGDAITPLAFWRSR